VQDTIAPVPGLGAQTLAEFLDAVAEATPAPGGGTSAACTAALAAALVEMAARLAGESDAAERSRRLRTQALAIAEQELSSYEPVLEAMRLPRDDPTRAPRLESALIDASATPLAIAQAAAEVAELGVAVARQSSREVSGDAVTGTLLAEAAAAAAAGLVEVNLERQPGAAALGSARAARVRAWRAREDAATLRPSAQR
jgi:formiminotetrahydrofolate cyclodeaminase